MARCRNGQSKHNHGADHAGEVVAAVLGSKEHPKYKARRSRWELGSPQTTQISPPAPWTSLGRTIGKRPASANHRPHPSRLGTSNRAPFPKPSAPASVLMKTKVQPVYVFVPPGVQQRLWERLGHTPRQTTPAIAALITALWDRRNTAAETELGDIDQEMERLLATNFIPPPHN